MLQAVRRPILPAGRLHIISTRLPAAMASDGCQPVAWTSQGGFPHLLHRPSGRSESYADARHSHGHGAAAAAGHEQQASGSGRGSDRTGVWNGPAPRGYVAEPMHAQDESAALAGRPVNDPPTAVLPGGSRMPLLGLGTYKLESADAVKAALQCGYRHIDCATSYGNQALIGQGLADFIAEGKRGELFITSKVWNDQHRPEEVSKSAEQSIAELGCSYLDLLLIHWPVAWLPGTEEQDTEVTLQQTWRAMEALVGAGRVRHLGLSNFPLRLVEEVLSWAAVKPVVNQVETQPLLAQRKLIGVCLRKGVQTVAYSPLGHSGPELLTHPTVLEVAAAAGKTPAQVLLKWNVQRGVAVIPKAGSAAHVAENAEGLFTWRLTWDQKAKLDALDCGRRFVNVPAHWHTWEDPEEGGAAKPSVVLK